MRKYARFAVSSLSVLLMLPALAADLRAMKDPAKIASAFPAAAKVRVLNVWAMWCAPCVAEMPDLQAIDDAFGAELAVAGVTLDDMLPDTSSINTTNFLNRKKIAFPNIYYKGNADDLARLLRFSGEVPLTIVYDGKGNELWRHQGRLDREKTIARLRQTLKEMP
jgi:thiol-disulfide isomerase/thioredoxin